MAFHNFSSSSMRSPHATFSNASVPTGVLRIFIPCGLRTSGGKSHSWGALSCLVPHPRVSNVEWNPRSLQTNKSWTVLVRSGMQTTHSSSRNVKRCSLGRRESLHLSQGTEEASRGHHVHLPRVAPPPNGHRAHRPTQNVSELRRRIGQKEPTHGAVGLPPTWSASQSGRGHQHRFRQLTER